MNNPARNEIKEILDQSKSIAVVGLSPNPDRTSYMVPEAMQKAGYRIIPVNPMADEVLGEKSYPSLTELPETPDIVNVFRRSEFLPALAGEFLQTDSPVFWTQLGVADEDVRRQLEEAGRQVVMDRCIKVEHAMVR